jgi:uncharacterized membrane protein
MDFLFKLLLTIHVITGMCALIIGAIVLTLKKGNKQHRLIGNLFYYCMLSAALISMPMAVLHPNYFLFIVGVFTTYMLLSGRRYLKIKTEKDVLKSDWLLVVIMLIFGFVFIILGVYNLIYGLTFGFVFLVFGLISLGFVRKDYLNYTGKSKIKNFGLLSHIQRMVGSYIASVTAFIVVNNHGFVADILAWLLPTLILTPLIFKWSKERSITK